MSDYPEKPWDPAAEPTRPDEEERPNLRELSKDALEAILKEHKKWLESVKEEEEETLEQRLQKFMEDSTWDERPGANLQSRNLQGEEFEKADLRWANFRRANLQRADFRRAELHHTLFFRSDLGKADLRDANLAKADLQRADLKKAHLLGANLREANLQDADLRDVTGLLGKQLAGANVSGAKLPDDIAEFKALDHVTEISKHARNIFLAAIGGCVFSWLTIATTTDVALLTNTASTPLPIIQTKVPIAGFYWAAPAILLALYFYLHFYLQSLWEGLASLPAIFPDGRTLDERAYPWLMTSLVREFVLLLTKERLPFTSLKAGISIFAAWGLIPFTFVWFWLRYLTRHDWSGTIWHILLIVVAAVFGAVAFKTALATLRGKLRKPQVEATTSIREHWKRKLRSLPYYRPAPLTAIVTAVTVVLTVSVSLGAIEGEPGRLKLDPWTWIPSLFEFVDYRTHADLIEEQVSTRPEDWWRANDKQEKELKGIKGANLRGRNLRHASARGAFLAKADLHKANLEGADLEFANLQGADLSDAKLQDAKLNVANLQGANLIGAKLRGTKLGSANLKGAFLNGVNLQGANLSGVNLQGAILAGANFQRAGLARINLQGAILGGANLKEADLRWAYLQGAFLREADLQGAILESANLQGADLRGADLRWAEGLTQEQLDEACGDEKTKPPDHMIGYKMKPCPEERK